MAGKAPLHHVIVGLESFPDTAVIAAARLVKDIAKREATRDIGSDLRMSHAGRRGRKLTTRDDFQPGSGAASVTVSGLPPAMWSWITNGTQPHLIGVTKSGKRRRGSRRFISFGPGQVRYAPIKTGGIQNPPGTWTRVRKEANRLVPLLLSDVLHESLN